ncbi:MAG: polymer-forming cytoskeletal protein [Deltaproteobacteria bacterium]|nr:polymer-forming cytoskeletal protein [Deltaproteobacteria bacterium]MBW2577137.1 polymer-forming cytoskeletal protein [Deltaproteobacteria bacterium]MBW2692115.1 polymer-forming cytoskeletal protein [Deltaproteobacteria bacterium]
MSTISSGWEKLEVGRRFGRRGAAAEEAPKPPVEEEHTALIHEGCEVEGSLAVENSLRVQGDFRGRIKARKTVTIDERASVTGDIQARIVIIHGAVVGDVTASREVVIQATGRLHGDVKAPAFQVERGAFLNGRTEMYRPERVVQSQTDEDLGAKSIARTHSGEPIDRPRSPDANSC